MKHMFLNKILRNDKNIEAPTDWPANITNIEQEALELKKTTHDICKRIQHCPIFIGCTNCNSTSNQIHSTTNSNTNHSTTNHNDGVNNAEKTTGGLRIKKLPEQTLANCLLNSSERFHNLNPHLSQTLQTIGTTQQQLGNERIKLAVNIEKNVLDKMRLCYEDSIPSLIKNRRHLWKQSSELRNMQDRLRHLESSSNNTNVNPTDQQSNLLNNTELNNSVSSTNSTNVLLSPSNQNTNHSITSLPPSPQPIVTNTKESNHDKNSSSIATNEQVVTIATALSYKDNNQHQSHHHHSNSVSLNCVSNSNNHSNNTNANTTNISPINSNNNIPNNNNNNNNSNVVGESNKLSQLKNNRDELENQIDHLKDLSLREHFRFESTTVDLSKALLEYIRNESNYHQQCLRLIGQILPDLESSIANNPIPVFSRELREHLLTSRRHIAYTIEVCIRYLDQPTILSEEGLFRIAGGKNKVDTLSSAFNVFQAEHIISNYDHYVIADCLKQYLRSLPEPLLTQNLFNDWMDAVNQDTQEQILESMKTCLSKLPVEYRTNLSYLIGFLHKLTQYSNVNRMTAANLGILFGPSLLIASNNSISNNANNHESLHQGTNQMITSKNSNFLFSGTNTVGRKKVRSVSAAANHILLRKQHQTNNSSSSQSNSQHMVISSPIQQFDSNSSQQGITSALDLSGGPYLNYGDSHGPGNKINKLPSGLQSCIINNDNCMTKSMMSSTSHGTVVETLIQNFELFFPNQSINFSSDIPTKVILPNTGSSPNNHRQDANNNSMTTTPVTKQPANTPSNTQSNQHYQFSFLGNTNNMVTSLINKYRPKFTSANSTDQKQHSANQRSAYTRQQRGPIRSSTNASSSNAPINDTKNAKRRRSIDSSTTNGSQNYELSRSNHDNNNNNINCSQSGNSNKSKSSATTPTGKKSSEFRNGTVFPSCFYRRRISDGNLNTEDKPAEPPKPTDHPPGGKTKSPCSSFIMDPTATATMNTQPGMTTVTALNTGASNPPPPPTSTSSSSSRFIGSIDISDLPDIDSICYDHDHDDDDDDDDDDENDDDDEEEKCDRLNDDAANKKDSESRTTDDCYNYDYRDEYKPRGDYHRRYSAGNDLDDNTKTNSGDKDEEDNTITRQKTKYKPKSFHADVYDTLFALQSLNSSFGSSGYNVFSPSASKDSGTSTTKSEVPGGKQQGTGDSRKVDDYLSRVRSVYEGRTLLGKGSRTPLTRRQTFTSPIEDIMSRSVTSDTPISKSTNNTPNTIATTSTNNTDSIATNKAPIIRRNKPNLFTNSNSHNDKTNKSYRDSSPANFQSYQSPWQQQNQKQNSSNVITPSTSSTNLTGENSRRNNKVLDVKTMNNKPTDHEGFLKSNNSDLVRYSMPILPIHGISAKSKN